MDQRIQASAISRDQDFATNPSALDRTSQPHSLFRRALRRGIHFFSYNFILNRQEIRKVKAAGFTLSVYPSVFHPSFFVSSECFARFLDGLDLSGKTVADVGTGTGILALAAARAGAEHVAALDINPNAVLAANENAKTNGFEDRVIAIWSNLLSALPAEPTFDIILSSPPKHAGEPRDMADAGWHAGAGYRLIAGLFEQARVRLNPGGKMYVMVSSDTDLAFFGQLIAKAGFTAKKVHEHSIFIESFIIYELTPETTQAKSLSF